MLLDRRTVIKSLVAGAFAAGVQAGAEAPVDDFKSRRHFRVWDVHTGNIVSGPFKGHTDYVTFVAFSPDGAHITASNATNNKGFVFIAAVITRNTWTSEISLVGHENTVEVAVSCLLSLAIYF